MGKPKIRFKGYADDWEQRKLGGLCNITTGKLDANAMVSDGQYDFYTSGIDVFKIDIAAFEGPAITIAGNGASVGYMHLADGKFNAYQRTYVLTDFLADRQFLNVAIGNKLPDKIQEEVRGSGIPYIVLNMLTDLAIPFPSHEEQQQIGAYFSNLDHLITLHQRKCDETKKLKKYMLQKMFPQNGEKVPKIRFAGFSDDWEQRKFSELYVRSSEKNDGSIGMDKNITVATMQFKEDVQVSTAEYLKTYYTFNLGDIAFEGHQNKEFRYGRFVENDIGNGIVSHIFAVFRPIQEYDLYFWKYAINNETLMQRILGRSTKASTMMHDLVANDFLNETFLVPSIDEQKQIGSLFNKLDHLITLHQQKCDELQNIKKFMLKNMFA